jgi:hypothetical protein
MDAKARRSDAKGKEEKSARKDHKGHKDHKEEMRG